MSYRNYNVVVWIPYGREKTVSILINYLLANKDILDQVWLCMNTDPEQESDREYAKLLEEANPGFIKRVDLPKKEKRLQPKQLNTGKFYRFMTDPQTVYIRMDDDLVWLDDNYFKNMLDFRIDNPEYFVTFGQIWNNSIISYLQQHVYKNLDEQHGIVREPFAMDVVAWQSPTFAEYIHRVLLEHIHDNTTTGLYFDKYELPDPRRFSVSNFAHFGKDFAKFDGDLKGEEEEQWITEKHTATTGLRNAVCGSALICHWAFFAQRPHLEMNTDLLDEYRKLAQQKYSDSYYKLLNIANEKAKVEKML